MPTRAVRFSDSEDEAIKKFIKNNPYFDFSTIARMAILQFIEDPKIDIVANEKENTKDSKERVQ